MELSAKAKYICDHSKCGDTCKLWNACASQPNDNLDIWKDRMNKAADEPEDL